MSYIPYMNNSCHTQHTWSDVAKATGSSWQRSNMDRQRYVGRESWRIYTWNMTYTCQKAWLIHVWWHIHLKNMTHTCKSVMSRDSYAIRTHVFIRGTGLIHLCGTTFLRMIKYGSTKVCGTWDMTDSYMGHETFIYGTWLIHIWDMTHTSVWHDSLPMIEYGPAIICGTWLIHLCGTNLSSVRHGLVTIIESKSAKVLCVTLLIYVYIHL